MKRTVLLLLTFALLTAAAPAFAFGPGVHVREALATLERMNAGEGNSSDRALLQKPNNRFLFELGAIFPDIGRRVPSIGFQTHDFSVIQTMLAATQDPVGARQEALRAFVLGNAQHVMSDISAQVFFTPIMTARTDVGVVDIMVDSSDGVGGENEFFVELVGDLYNGDLHEVVDLYFALNDPATELLVRGAVIDYYTLAGGALGTLPLTPEAFADGVQGFLDQVASALGTLDAGLAHTLVDSILNGDPATYIDVLTGQAGAALGLSGVDLASIVIDPLARRALEANLFYDKAFYIETYADWYDVLGPAFLLHSYTDDTLFSDWQTWRGPTLLAASLQSLAWHLPGSLAVEPDLLVWRLEMFDGAGQPLTTLDALAPPAEVRVELEVFSSNPTPATVTLSLRGDRAGFARGLDPLLGSTAIELQGIPAIGAPPTRHSAVLTLSPGPLDELVGLYVELSNETRVEAVGEAFLVGSRDAYRSADTVDLGAAVWKPVFDGSAGWQPYLPIANATVSDARAFVEVEVRNARLEHQGVPAATFEVESAGVATSFTCTTAGTGALTTLAGSFTVDPATLVAEDFVPGFETPLSFDWPAGVVSALRLDMEPVPEVVVTHPYPLAGKLRARVVTDRFAPGQAFEYAVAPVGGAVPTDFAPLVGVGIAHEVPAADLDKAGFQIYVRAADGAIRPVGVSDVITLDSTPPVLTVVSRTFMGDGQVSVEASDPETGVVSLHLRVLFEGAPLLELVEESDAFVWELAAYEIPEFADLEVWAVNGVGLESEVFTDYFRWAELSNGDVGRVDEGSPDSDTRYSNDNDWQEGHPCSCRLSQRGEGPVGPWLVVGLVGWGGVRRRRRS
ncbi:MAG: hypothetical protein AUK47_00840 [Deltaproteobacteria bacterium CG2_30_63_29]|nr:MAG: hypothetical protein AUK47_00840 [Deltaproteobacteria bacterium CG2_30_63_29]